jgi:hypothetical protein
LSRLLKWCILNFLSMFTVAEVVYSFSLDLRLVQVRPNYHPLPKFAVRPDGTERKSKPPWNAGQAVICSCSFMIHVRHAPAAIASGLCETVLITHGESDRSGVGRIRNVVAPTSLAGQFEQPLWANGATDFIHDPGAALHDLLRHPRESGGPGASDEVPELWVPAFAGTTK